MIRLMWTSKSGMIAQQEKLDSISNNLVNATTDGYKRVTTSFSDLLNDSLDRRGYPLTNRAEGKLQHSVGVRTNKWIRDNNQGALRETNRKTDVALDGEGYFQITLMDGSKGYTRSGSFNLDINGDLVDKNGNYVDIVENGRNVKLSNLNFDFKNEDLYINEKGTVSIKNGNNFMEVGDLQIKKFIGEDALISRGDSIYIRNEGSTMVNANDFSIYQGYTEQSNVKMEDEITELMLAQRAFQMSSNALKTSDEMWGMVNNLRGR